MTEERLKAALIEALEELGIDGVNRDSIRLDQPRDPSHGDLTTNVALTLASSLGRPPRSIAEEIAGKLPLDTAGLVAVEVAGPGFLNFRLSSTSLGAQLAEIIERGEDLGRSDIGGGQPVMVEWVSANPTGPLHLGHGRQAALGDAIASLLEWTGWVVHREFYYNDAGTQMDMLARSVLARYRQAAGQDDEVPEGGYMGEYVREVATSLREEVGDRFDAGDVPEMLDFVREFASSVIMREIQSDLAEFGVTHDEYFEESSLYRDGRVASTTEALRGTGLVYDLDGAVWLKTTDFGDQKDRVMIRSSGEPTYFLPDVAYHMSKWERGFERVVNVQGSDHHSTVDRVRAGLQALGLPPGYPEYVLHQMVTVERGGEEVKFSKRAGSYTTLRDLFEEVGVDVTRWFFQMRKPESHLTFDLDVALDQSDKNPVFKVQYAHARMHSIFSKAEVTPKEIETLDAPVDRLTSDSERELVKQLSGFPLLVEKAAELRAPHLVCDFLEQTAGMVNSWYHSGNPSRNPELAVLVEDQGLRNARLTLARAVQLVLGNGLAMLGIHAPIRMDRPAEQGVES